jgi:hypothetical protein
VSFEQSPSLTGKFFQRQQVVEGQGTHEPFSAKFSGLSGRMAERRRKVKGISVFPLHGPFSRGPGKAKTYF